MGAMVVGEVVVGEVVLGEGVAGIPVGEEVGAVTNADTGPSTVTVPYSLNDLNMITLSRGVSIFCFNAAEDCI